MSTTTGTESDISIPGTRSQFLDPTGADPRQGRLRYLTGGSGAPLVLLHTVRTQAEHYRHLIPLVQQNYTVYALDLPGMGYSQIVSGASYEEPAMRAGVKRLLTQLDLHDVTIVGESMGATLAGGIARSSLLARLIVTGVIAPGVGPLLARLEPKPVMRAILSGGLADPAALRDDYLDELLKVGRRPGYSTVARGVYRNLPGLAAARARYPQVTAPVHLVYGEQDWSRPSDRQANRRLLPDATFTEVPNAGHFIALERPDAPAALLNSVV
jgi:pimeloyl-ACP methyl ester carboxylesterase